METERVKISQLQVNEQNPRTCTDKQFEKLVRSVITFPKMLEVRPIVVGECGVALGGNMRLRALQAIATMTDEEIMSHIEQSAKYNDRTECEREALLRYWQKWQHDTMVTVVRTENMTEDERREFIIKDNVGFGAWDWDMLANDWDTDELDDWGLSAWVEQPTDEDGDNDEDDEEHKEATEDEFNEDEEEIPRRCKECELWQLGRHRLLCGDSTDSEQVKFLMGEQEANMVFTDPPYGVSIGDKNATLNSVQKAGSCTENIKNDTLQPDRLYPLLVKAMTNCRESCADDATYFVTSPQGGELGMMMMMMMKDAGLPVRHILIWEKNSATFSLGRLDYDYQHEPIFYTWAKKHKNYRKGEFRTTIWKYDKPRKCDLHPTMKPVELVANCMKDGTVEGDSVLDVFGGSGTTLIAAEQLNRNAFVMELDPHYCDVIIARWEKLTGEKAVKIGEFNKEGE